MRGDDLIDAVLKEWDSGHQTPAAVSVGWSWILVPNPLVGTDGTSRDDGRAQAEPGALAPAFMSYVRDDALAVDQIQAALVRAGIPVWRDVNELVAGTRWRTEIRKAIAGGGAFVAFFSSQSEDRDKSYMREELIEAVDELRRRRRDRPWFIPVRLSPCDLPNLPIGPGEILSDLHYINIFSADDATAIGGLVKALRVACAT